MGYANKKENDRMSEELAIEQLIDREVFVVGKLVGKSKDNDLALEKNM